MIKKNYIMISNPQLFKDTPQLKFMIHLFGILAEIDESSWVS